uniref:Anaphase-promoting complex subunit 2 TPR repeats domain-containing protein n=1 Tax=Setaria digitata TaxID=48799 RepID=A0A915PXR5_9BILA
MDPETGCAICREFVTTTILPRFRRTVEHLLSLPNHSIISALHETVISIENVLDEIEKKMKILVSNAFKASFLLHEALKSKDIEGSKWRETLLSMLRETVLHLIDPVGFDVISVVSQAHNQSVWHIIADVAKHKCMVRTEKISLADNTGRCRGITDWTVAIGLARLKPTKKTLQQAMEKCFITTLAEKRFSLTLEGRTDRYKNVMIMVANTCIYVQIYDLVIVEYPESSGVIDDLRYCMQNNGGFGRTLLMDVLTKDVEKRLLQVGVGTTEILEGYASAVECLRRLDPTCVIMQKICSTIRQYIK